MIDANGRLSDDDEFVDDVVDEFIDDDEFVDDEVDEFIDNDAPVSKKQKTGSAQTLSQPMTQKADSLNRGSRGGRGGRAGRASGRASGRSGGRGKGRGRQGRRQTKMDKAVNFQTHYDPLTSILYGSEDEFVDDVDISQSKHAGVQSAQTLSFRPATEPQGGVADSAEDGVGREPIQPSQRSFGTIERLKRQILATQSQLATDEDDFVDEEDTPKYLLNNAATAADEAIHEWNQLRLAHETNLVVVRHVLTDELDATHARVSRLLDRLNTPTVKQEDIERAIVELDQTNCSMQQLCAYEASAIDRLGHIDQPLARAVMIPSGRLCI